MACHYQRRRYEQLKADRTAVEQAAAHLRHRATLDAYAGLEHKHVACGLALILDEIARHFRDLDEQVRARTAAGLCLTVRSIRPLALATPGRQP